MNAHYSYYSWCIQGSSMDAYKNRISSCNNKGIYYSLLLAYYYDDVIEIVDRLIR